MSTPRTFSSHRVRTGRRDILLLLPTETVQKIRLKEEKVQLTRRSRREGEGRREEEEEGDKLRNSR